MVYVSKWHSLAAGAVFELVAGVAYTFSLWAPAIKAALNLSQPQLEGVGSAILCGGLTAWLPGWLYDALTPHHKLGPRLTAGIGLVSHCTGYLLIWAAATGTVRAPFWVVVAAGLLASSGLLWLDTASIVTSIRNFPAERGPVAGLLKTFLGLSASIATTVYSGGFAPHGLDFLLFLAVGPTAAGLLALPLLNYVPHVEENELVTPGTRLTTERRLLAVCGVVGLLLLYQMATALLSRGHPDARFAVMVAALAVLAAAVLIIPAGTGGLRSKPARLHGADDGSEEAQRAPLLPASASATAAGERVQRRGASPGLEEGQAAASSSGGGSGNGRREAAKGAVREWGLRQCLASLDFWWLWSSMLVGIGSGFTLLNNLGQHVEALGGKPGAQDVYVLLFTTSNCLGRMLSGYGSEWLLHRFATPRTAVLLGLSAATALTFAAVALAGLRLLLACCVLAGLTFGAHWALMPCCTSDLFGVRHLAANQSVQHLSTAVGALLLSSGLAATLFERRGAAHRDPHTTCFGADCFRDTYLAIAGLALLQTGLSAALHLRSRPLYAQLHARLQKYEQEVHS